jgi:hypothetical protein
MNTAEERQLGRAKNAVLEFLERRLQIPKIFLDARWADESVDVLAIDRDGVGDVHAALLYAREYTQAGSVDAAAEQTRIDDLLQRFAKIPAQYKYIVAVEANIDRAGSPWRLSEQTIDRSYAGDGVGRIGFVLVDFLLNADAQARVLQKPERFRAKIAKLADAYIMEHTADWELRA